MPSRLRTTGASDSKSPSTNLSPLPSPRQQSSSSSSSGFFSSFSFSQPTLQVHIPEPIIYLRPEAHDLPSNDPVLRGTVTLHLPKPRTLTSLSVRLQSKYNISWPQASAKAFETGSTLDKRLFLVNHADGEGGEEGGEGLKLDKGEHVFEWAFVVPSGTACFERSLHGRVRQSVVAKAKGLGTVGGDVKSEEFLVHFVVNPGGAGELIPPPTFEHAFQGFRDDLGPYSFSLQSHHIMIGGLLLFSLALPSPPTSLVLFSAKVKVNQYFALASPASPEMVFHPPVDIQTILTLDGSNADSIGKVEGFEAKNVGSTSAMPGPLRILRAGEEFRISNFSRLSNCDFLRATTHPWTTTPIAIKHEICVELVYREVSDYELQNGLQATEMDENGKERPKERKRLTATHPFELFSCTCYVSSLTPPPYTLEKPEVNKDVPPCICDYSFKLLLETHSKGLNADTALRNDTTTRAPLQKTETSSSGGSRVV